MRVARAAALVACTACVSGHGYVVDPPPRAARYIKGHVAGVAGSCATGICLWFNQGCTIGCPKCGGSDGSATCGAQQGKETIPKYARSLTSTGELCGTSPWCAPGSAPIMNPCGVAGGDTAVGKPGNGGEAPYGAKQGDDGRLLPSLPAKVSWAAGSKVNISWALIANHGGGYQYRLCKKTQKPTEACFQATPMPFVGGNQYINYCISAGQYPPYNSFPGSFPHCDPDNSTAIPAVDVSAGTVPAGSTWRRNPIPGCKTIAQGAFGWPCGENNGSAPTDYEFPPAGPDLSRPGYLLGGFGAASCYGQPFGHGCGDNPGEMSPTGAPPGTEAGVWSRSFHFNVVDTVVVPQLPAGEYIMSYRWDCEQTPQIWSTCSDVTITAPPTPGGAAYGCTDSACVADPSGVPLSVCQSVCHK